MLDYFAAAALQGMLHGLLSRKGAYVAEKDWVELLAMGSDDDSYDTAFVRRHSSMAAVSPEDCAADAYRIAKAMLEEREKHGSEE